MSWIRNTGTKLTKTSVRTDTTLVDEAFSFLEQNRVTIRPERDDFSDSVAEFMQRNRLKINLQAAQPVFNLLPSCLSYFYSTQTFLRILFRIFFW
jgi:hypothetical protein